MLVCCIFFFIFVHLLILVVFVNIMIFLMSNVTPVDLLAQKAKYGKLKKHGLHPRHFVIIDCVYV